MSGVTGALHGEVHELRDEARRRKVANHMFCFAMQNAALGTPDWSFGLCIDCLIRIMRRLHMFIVSSRSGSDLPLTEAWRAVM